MNLKKLHKWDVDPKEAAKIQERLVKKLSFQKSPGDVDTIAGCDVSFSSTGLVGRAAVCVFSFPSMELIEFAFASDKVRFPYISGLLSFREAPVLAKCFKKIKLKPDVILFDGQGIVHPRGFGLASHMGLLLGTPSIGCAKSFLCGNFKNPGRKKGNHTAISNGNGKKIGVCLRTKDNAKPIFVSCGNMVKLDKAVDITLRCCTKYRIPEPLRYAHSFAKLGRKRRLA
ncbi:MAG: deoxyribonuclease V [Candidatus Omnitrophota bacterium]